MKNKSVGSRVLIIALSILAAVFIVWNVVWFSFVHIVYQPLIDAVGYNDQGVCSVDADDGYRYTVFKPSYLTFLSNLTIHSSKPFNERVGEDSISLIIWPKFLGSYEYGVKMTVPIDNGGDELSFEAYGFMLDENMNPTEELSNYERKVLEDNKEVISLLYDKAYDMWGIGG